jgi:hypothetical protein
MYLINHSKQQIYRIDHTRDLGALFLHIRTHFHWSLYDRIDLVQTLNDYLQDEYQVIFD